MLPALGERSSLCPTDSCLSCGRRNPATFHPLFKGGLCQTCRVSAAVLGLSRSLGPEDLAGVQPVLLGQVLAMLSPWACPSACSCHLQHQRYASLSSLCVLEMVQICVLHPLSTASDPLSFSAPHCPFARIDSWSISTCMMKMVTSPTAPSAVQARSCCSAAMPAAAGESKSLLLELRVWHHSQGAAGSRVLHEPGIT